MTNDTRPREWIIPAEWQVSGEKFYRGCDVVRVVEYAAYEAAIKRAEAAEKERDELKVILSGRTFDYPVATNPNDSECAGVREK